MTHRSLLRAALAATLTLVAISQPLSAQQSCPAMTPGATMPLTYQGGPTVAAITPCDLMTRLYIYSADSLRGREAGTPDAIHATAWIEQEVRRLGLRPAGDNGTYFQAMPVSARVVTSASTIVSGGKTFHTDVDFYPGGATADRKITADVVYGGVLGDSVNALSADDARGKIVVMTGAANARGVRNLGAALAGAEAIALVSPTIVQPRLRYVLNDTVQNEGRAAYAGAASGAGAGGRGGPGAGGPLTLAVSSATAATMLGKPVENARLGDKGGSTTIDVKVEYTPEPTRSVVAILDGTDPKLRNEYIVIGAHSDHIGVANIVAEHDSIKAYNEIARVEGADSRNATAPTPEQWTRINAIKDSLRRVYPARLDSISNGADDDGSGSVSILEIAEAFAKGPVKPKRSLIFIWQTGE
ncbi:MAG TPA: M28 family peptidase, partial [Gemmatimonadaceae bacterium]